MALCLCESSDCLPQEKDVHTGCIHPSADVVDNEWLVSEKLLKGSTYPHWLHLSTWATGGIIDGGVGEGLTALGSYKWGTHHCWREIGDGTENLFQYAAAVCPGIFSLQSTLVLLNTNLE